MSDSLRDQFLQLGLVNEQTLKKSLSNKSHPKSKAKAQGARPKVNPPKQAAVVVQAPATPMLDKKQAGEARKALFQQLRQIVLTQRLNDEKADIAFYFQHQQHVKKMYLTAEQKTQLLANQLCIVNVKTRYHLVTAEVAQTMSELLPETRVVLEDLKDTAVKKDSDDPYANYEVPDDLIW